MTDSSISILRAGAARLRRGGLWVIFALVLMIPKVNRLRRRRRAWNFIRILVAIAGAAILVFGLARGHGFALIFVGALMLLFGLLLNAERPEISIDARAKELGALITVDGGRLYRCRRKPASNEAFCRPRSPMGTRFCSSRLAGNSADASPNARRGAFRHRLELSCGWRKNESGIHLRRQLCTASGGRRRSHSSQPPQPRASSLALTNRRLPRSLAHRRRVSACILRSVPIPWSLLADAELIRWRHGDLA